MYVHIMFSKQELYTMSCFVRVVGVSHVQYTGSVTLVNSVVGGFQPEDIWSQGSTRGFIQTYLLYRFTPDLFTSRSSP